CRSAGAAPAHLRGRVGLCGGPDGALEVLVDLEELVEPRDGEDPAHALVRRGDGHRPAVPRETLEASDDDPQTGGVEEGDIGQVEGQPPTAIGDERLESIAEHGGG